MTEQAKQRLLVVSGVEFTRSYSGTLYLLTYLAQQFALEVIVRTTPPRKADYKSVPFPCIVWSWWDPAWNIAKRRLSGLLLSMYVMYRMLGAERVLIVEGNFLREAAWVRRLRRRKLLLIQFCQELQIVEDYPCSWLASVYYKYARDPDIVIDVDPFRARARREYYGLPRTPYVLRNTLPASAVPSPLPRGTLLKIADFPGAQSNLPILVYVGAVGKANPLERLIECVAAAVCPCIFLAFCSATDDVIMALHEFATQRLPLSRFKICAPRPRAELLAALSDADIGAVDYSYSVEPSLNQKYCAPTKLYEYLACGLAVLGSNSDSLRAVVEANGVGRCAASDEIGALSAALDEILTDRLALSQMKRRSREVFLQRYAYEQCCLTEVARIIADIRSLDTRVRG